MDDREKIYDEVLDIAKLIRKYQLPYDYPEVSVNYGDRKWLPLLFDDYASRVSETTAVMQYNFAHFTTEAVENLEFGYKEASDAFLGISIIEMFHLEKIANVITSLGEKPVYVNGMDKYWKSKFVPYGNSPIENLKLAIKAEKDAIDQYEFQIRVIQNESIRNLLRRIVEDEKHHLDIFTKILNKLT